MIGVLPEDRPNTEIFGFNLDAAGNMLLAVPVLFKAYVSLPTGAPRRLGSPDPRRDSSESFPGSRRTTRATSWSPTSSGALSWSFDRAFQFVQEFGHRGDRRRI